MLTRDQPVFYPAEVHTLEESGLPYGLVLDLVLKYAYYEGTVTQAKLVERSRLGPPIIHTMYRHLQREQLCETRGMVGNDYEFVLTNKGRSMAEAALAKSQYAGPAPVTLQDYNKSVSAQALRLEITADSLRTALHDLVLPEEVIRQLGIALVTGGAILLYGTTGNGKTSIAERLHRVFDDYIYLPYALEVSSQIVTVLDPLIHGSDRQEAEPHSDRRWVRCRRPMVKVGGEMRADMLDTKVDEVTRVCTAPLQMKANNGILLIDDFGRQRITPRELLNRWIVPLDRRTDILTLWSGVSFEIKFEALVTFATNLPLSDLAEDAFLRRLKNKIKIETMSPDLFNTLLERVCKERGLACTPAMEEYIALACLKHSPDGLRACYPADLIKLIGGIAAFQQRPPSLDKSDVDEAVKMYFAR